MKKHVPKHLFSRELDALDIKVGDLRRFYKSHYAALQVLDIFAARKKDSRTTTVNSIVASLKGAAHVISRSDVIRVFEALQRFNCGVFIKEKFIKSAVSQTSRFEWRVSLVIVGGLAADKKIR